MEILRFGTSQLLSNLTNGVDEATATNVIRFALQAVGTSAEKLELLVISIYNMSAIRGEAWARLLVKLSEYTPSNICTVVVKSGKTLRGRKLVRHCVLNECERGFQDIADTHWPGNSIEHLSALYNTKELAMTDRVMGTVLRSMAESKVLFVHENFELFANACFTCGPKLDKNTKVDHLTAILAKASARASTESITSKLMIAGLLAIRDNDWEMEIDVAPRVFTPEGDSELESEGTL